MSDKGSGYKHDASDKKLDQSAELLKDDAKDTDTKHAEGPGHDPEKISRHDDAGKDRLFEGREQRDDAEMKSEKTRRARDEDKHHHPDDEPAAGG